MRFITVIVSLALGLLLAGCGSEPTRYSDSGASARGQAYFTVDQEVPAVTGDFAGDPAVERFVQRMVSRYGFDPDGLRHVLSRARHKQWIINQMPRSGYKRRQKTRPTGSWNRYRAKFITSGNIHKGVRFWRRHAKELQRASKKYGVPPEIIVGIIGVETRWGRITGNTRVIDALATLAFDYPRRADFFIEELEHFLIMARSEGFDPFKPQGSYAGAMGYGQFMPSSFREYAVDFNGDGRRDLWNTVDTIGSVANYFKGYGWRSGEPVAFRAVSARNNATLEIGFKTRYSLDELAGFGIRPAGGEAGESPASLIRLDVGSDFEYWLGQHNFYVITRYNHSSYYAMAVWQLGNAVKSRMGRAG